jgi:hypothetical protein
MVKLAVVVALAGTFLSGCCWPMEARPYRYGYGEWSQGYRNQAPERRGGDEWYGWRDAPQR